MAISSPSYNNPSLKEQASSAISRNFPRITVTISQAIGALGKNLWRFLVEMFHDAIGR